jgi:hypothetical protein
MKCSKLINYSSSHVVVVVVVSRETATWNGCGGALKPNNKINRLMFFFLTYHVGEVVLIMQL